MKKKPRYTLITLFAFFYTAGYAADSLIRERYDIALAVAIFTFVMFRIKPRGL